jgi:hypothetical protein
MGSIWFVCFYDFILSSFVYHVGHTPISSQHPVVTNHVLQVYIKRSRLKYPAADSLVQLNCSDTKSSQDTRGLGNLS